MEMIEQVAVPSATLDQETPVLKEQVVEEILARLRKGASVQGLAAEYGVDRKTIRAWRTRGGYVPRHPRVRMSILEPHREWLTARAPEVDFNAAVLFRELAERGYTGSSQQVLRFVRPLRVAARQRNATVRFETAPGQQAQVDFGQLRVWIGEPAVDGPPLRLHARLLAPVLRVRVSAMSGVPALLDGHERAFRHFGGVPSRVPVRQSADAGARPHRRGGRCGIRSVEDFARYYGFTPRACQPYRPQTKGKVESGVKYVKRNALAGRRFGSWDGAQCLARGMGAHGGRSPHSRHDARAADRPASRSRRRSVPLGRAAAVSLPARADPRRAAATRSWRSPAAATRSRSATSARR